jgi:hypothetical protein
MGLTDASWRAAVRDSGADPETLVLIRLDGEPVGGPTEAWGRWLAPGEKASGPGLFPMSPSQVEEANDPDIKDTYRVLVHTGGEEALVYGFARHELEHVCQFQDFPGSLELNLCVVASFARALPPLPGSGRIYNLAPIERDANAAARLAIATRYPARIAPLSEGIHSALAAGTHMPDRGTLFFRTFCFAYLFFDAVNAVLGESGNSLESYAAKFHPEFRDALRQLEGSHELTDAIRLAYATLPTPAAVAAAGPRPGDAWTPAAEAFRSVYVRAGGLLGMQL